jgi:tetratricopeptide (TPR) repeat protein
VLALAAVPVHAAEEGGSNPEKAIKQYSKAVESNPDVFENWYNLGLAYIQLERFAEAVAPAVKAAELKPDNPRARFRAGEALAGSGKAEEALPHFKAAAELDPTLTVAHVRLGQAYIDAKKYQEGIDALKAALKTQPAETSPIYNSLGQAYLELKDTASATKWFEKTAEAAPNDPVTYFNLGVLYSRLAEGDASFYAKSGASYAKASDLDPKDAKTAYLAAEAYVFGGANAEAAKYLDRFFALDPKGEKVGPDLFQLAKELKAEVGK